MIVAGIGFRRSVAADEIVALVEQALDRAAIAADALGKLATVEALAALPAFTEAARRLNVVAASVAEPALSEAAPRVRTQSARSIAAHGIGSVAEAAALAAAGSRAELILERIASPSATCALARLETGP
ncbi:cobalamin biosynthesis protein [Chelatococcus composti]|jgi:Cobalamin synthesis G C-terminus.|uniref:Cobalt-precorrin 5A hydrolase n=2 Tax=Pseudomonadota TaxID=1224 RepID=A0A841KC80_9HYPH|nr:cobalamin biosynthesis protein [Chelatococcus composti]MBB6167053.1 cobalt-precorrin 5A hydrolase [Chelatococcus composti]GGG28840.1 precorrin methylase [Chelatococcus composti]